MKNFVLIFLLVKVKTTRDKITLRGKAMPYENNMIFFYQAEISFHQAIKSIRLTINGTHVDCPNQIFK